MTRKQLIAMREKINTYADKIRQTEDFGDQEQEYNELWETLDNAGACINEILGEQG